jgi:hypothetical protein
MYSVSHSKYIGVSVFRNYLNVLSLNWDKVALTVAYLVDLYQYIPDVMYFVITMYMKQCKCPKFLLSGVSMYFDWRVW